MPEQPREAKFRIFELTINVYVPVDAEIPRYFNEWVGRAFGIDPNDLPASATTLQRITELRYPLADDVVERRSEETNQRGKSFWL